MLPVLVILKNKRNSNQALLTTTNYYCIFCEARKCVSTEFCVLTNKCGFIWSSLTCYEIFVILRLSIRVCNVLGTTLALCKVTER